MVFKVFAAVPDPMWAIDPVDLGPNLPAAGRSLFDVIIARGNSSVAFPFSALIRHVEKSAGCALPCTTSVLIPLGRSLQRSIASPEFFKYPRAVVAVTGEGNGIFLKDRLYLGYQEKANLIEVISYNEEAGRFEFQLVKNYRAGATPRVVYANRAVCVTCHQNQSAIFSRQVWDETHANPRLRAMLAGERGSFYDITLKVGIGTPNSIDDSVARANHFSVMRRLWKDGCGTHEKCRRQVLIAALQYRLSGERGFDERAEEFRTHVVKVLAANTVQKWPGGLAVPNPGIPNRDPLAQSARGLALAHVPASLEPLLSRAPLEIWPAAGPFLARRMVMGVAALFSAREIRELERRIAAGGKAARKQIAAGCRFERGRDARRFRCEGEGLRMEGKIAGTSATLDSISVGAGPSLLHHSLSATGKNKVTLRPARRQIRLHDGNALVRIDLDFPRASATVHVAEDFSQHAKRFGQAPDVLARPGLLVALRMASPAAFVLAEAKVENEERALDATPQARAFHRHCALCHRSHEPTPPNFLHGDAQRVAAVLKHCAPRIFVRLSMGQLNPSAREKTPMPPPLAPKSGSPGEVGTLDENSLSELKATASDLLREETGQAPVLENLMAKGYENLRPCLPRETP